MNGQHGAKCRCPAAHTIVTGLKEVEGRYYEAIDLHDRVGAEDLHALHVSINSLKIEAWMAI